METSMSASASFDAGHSIAGIADETHHHGHRWTVTATVAGDLNPATGWPFGTEHLGAALGAIAFELHRRDLDEMLPDVVTSSLGIASYFLERLALMQPLVTMIEVECSDGTSGRIQRSRRQ